MDAILEIWLAEIVKASCLEQYQRTFTWGSIVYPQEPIYFKFDGQILFQRSAASYLIKFLPSELVSQTWLQLTVIPAILSNSLAQANIISAIETVLNTQSKWVMFWLVHCDQIDITGTASVAQVVEAVRQNFVLKDGSEGFAYWSI